MAGEAISGGLTAEQLEVRAACLRVAQVSSASMAAVALLALLGWASSFPGLATLWPEAIPMAPSTALAFVTTAFALRMVQRAGLVAYQNLWVLLMCATVLVVAALAWLPSAPLESLIRGQLGEQRTFRGFPLAVMSTATATLFTLAHLSLLGITLRTALTRQAAALGGVATATAGATVLLGYAFREPLFSAEDGVIPIAPSTGLAFACCGLAIACSAGADVWPLRLYFGQELRQRLTRAFLPATAGLVVLVSWAMAWVVPLFGGNAAIAAAVLVGASLLLIGLVVSRVALSISAVLQETERERLEARDGEHRAKARADSVLACVGQGLCGVDLEGLITFMNPAATELFGIAESDATSGAHHSRYFHGQQSSLERDPDCPICASIAAQQRVADLDATLRRADGALFPARLVSSPIRERGELVGMVASFADLTSQRQLEHQLRQAQKMEAVGSLAGGIAHDFNNLLAVILSYSYLTLERETLSDQAKEDLNEVVGAAERAAQLTGQLLAFSRQQVLQPKVLQLNSVVSGIERMIRRIVGEDVDVELCCAPDLGHTRADPSQLEQILMNLVVNARDALPHGGRITIETANVEWDESHASGHVEVAPGRYVMLAVTDNGVGMDAATQARIFEPFFTTKEVGRGTGLGLSTVFGIVKQSGGQVWVYSERGRGTTMKIYLPRTDETLAADPAFTSAVSGGHERILLIEDEPALCQAMIRVLQHAGYDVHVFRDGAAALEFARSERFDLVVTDVVMPAMGGPELVQRLREHRPEMRVLYTSGYTDRGVVREAMLEPDVAFLQKPFTPGALKRKVRDTLTDERQGA